MSTRGCMKKSLLQFRQRYLRRCARPLGVWADLDGAALVEFTILMPVLFLILFGIVEFGAMIWMQNNMIGAAREGARTASVRGGTMTDAYNRACNCLAGTGQTFTISASNTCNASVGEVTVQVAIDKSKASLMNKFFSLSGGHLTTTSWGGQIGASVTMRQEDSCT